ncbi:uncharacterized protein LOC133739552 [Rosa rugosa]|uniref:uncharacterized protein LOC133739552 n=1 Tax=Rosa rugosa TaxID=74645 RepID=UPI002B4049F7|nr:uncharacterized protein LOC133739552 [Rosa rugosa]
MALRVGMLRSGRDHLASIFGFRRWTHIAAMPPPSLFGSVQNRIASPHFVLSEFDREADTGFGFPSISFGGFMELMAVPKRKTSPHKRGIRNGPKALKPVRVIIRCKSCGRVKLPHYYCCSGHRGNDSNGSIS